MKQDSPEEWKRHTNFPNERTKAPLRVWNCSICFYLFIYQSHAEICDEINLLWSFYYRIFEGAIVGEINFLMATGFHLENSLKLQSSIMYLPMQTHWLSAIIDFHFYPLYVFKWHLPKQPWRYVPSLFLFCINIAELNRILANANKLISNNHWFSFLSTLHFQLTFT